MINDKYGQIYFEMKSELLEYTNQCKENFKTMLIPILNWFNPIKDVPPTIIPKVFKKKYTAVKCLHQTRKSGGVKLPFEKPYNEYKNEIPLNNDNEIDWCLECIGKMAIRCAWCSHPVIIGDPITLYSSLDKDFKPKKEPIKVYSIRNDGVRTFVGCLGWDCAESGADRAGFWIPDNDSLLHDPKGKVNRIPTAFEQIANGADSVVINDLSNP